jgi:hypothetical protein
MRYERPAIEQRVQVTGPVITVATVGSPTVQTPTWVPHDTRDGAGRERS